MGDRAKPTLEVQRDRPSATPTPAAPAASTLDAATSTLTLGQMTPDGARLPASLERQALAAKRLAQAWAESPGGVIAAGAVIGAAGVGYLIGTKSALPAVPPIPLDFLGGPFANATIELQMTGPVTSPEGRRRKRRGGAAALWPGTRRRSPAPAAASRRPGSPRRSSGRRGLTGRLPVLGLGAPRTRRRTARHGPRPAACAPEAFGGGQWSEAGGAGNTSP